MLNWTTYYPESLNVSIKGFVITWFSGPNGLCAYKNVRLNSVSNIFFSLSLPCKEVILHPAKWDFANDDN